ncbi:hypothetical protein [Pontixanthobacter luteolus]|uniref:hypothetical protein n=1 Tax=Pontixanthobacter luteolus TaxID=295089 RepID=UPI00230493F0|nr:hypothetical protein [Pontixanthobacter luteolus]
MNVREGLVRAAGWPFRKIRREIRLHRLARVRARGCVPAAEPAAPVPPCLIISPGGVGTTFLIDHCARFTSLNHRNDRDGLKHLPRFAGTEEFTRSRIIFVTGKPEDVFASLRRRGWLRDQAAKLGLPRALWLTGRARKAAFIAGVEAQAESFRAAAETGQVLMIDYEQIWDRKAEIARWFGIADPAFLADFPERRGRTGQSV